MPLKWWRCAAGCWWGWAGGIEWDYASYTAGVDEIGEPLVAGLAGITPRSSAVAFISTVTGEVFDGAGLDGRYWYRNIRQTVQFERAVRAAGAAGCRVFVEASAHPVLLGGMEDTLAAAGVDAVVVPTLGRGEGGWGRFVLSVGAGVVGGGGGGWWGVGGGGA